MRRLLILGLLLGGITEGATMPQPGVTAWQHLLTATRGEEMGCPMMQLPQIPMNCAIVPGDQDAFRAKVALQSEMQQVGDWTYEEATDTYSGDFRIDKHVYGMAVAIGDQNLAISLAQVK
ncbi:hypothetical protein [Deinococcus sp. UYEF24]